MCLIVDCVRQSLKEFFNVEQKELFMACNVPWTLSLNNISLEKAMEKENCSVPTATIQSLKLIEFFYISSGYLFPNCKGINKILSGFSDSISRKMYIIYIMLKQPTIM